MEVLGTWDASVLSHVGVRVDSSIKMVIVASLFLKCTTLMETVCVVIADSGGRGHHLAVCERERH